MKLTESIAISYVVFIVIIVLLTIGYSVQRHKANECERILIECVETLDTGMEAAQSCDEYVRMAERNGMLRPIDK